MQDFIESASSSAEAQKTALKNMFTAWMKCEQDSLATNVCFVFH